MTNSDEIARELERFYCHYAEVFNREDDGFFVYYAPIFQIVSNDGGLISVTNDARFWTDYMKALKQRGWVRSEVDRVKTWALADDLGMIIPDITRRKADNSVLDQMRGIYNDPTCRPLMAVHHARRDQAATSRSRRHPTLMLVYFLPCGCFRRASHMQEISVKPRASLFTRSALHWVVFPRI